MSTKKQRVQSIIKPLAAAFLTAEPEEEPVAAVKPQPKRASARSVIKPVEIKIGELSKEETRALLREQLVSGIADDKLLPDDDLFYDDELPFDEPLSDIDDDIDLEEKALKAAAAEKKAAEKKASEKKASEKKASDKKASGKKAVENKTSDNKTSDQKTSEKKASEKKASGK